MVTKARGAEKDNGADPGRVGRRAGRDNDTVSEISSGIMMFFG